YVERLLERARHIEVQVIGDGTGAVTHLWERECSIQRRHQKLVETAPAPNLSVALRERLLESAVALAREAACAGLVTFEFLVETSADSPESAFHFSEANPRVQVDHTVPEEVLGSEVVAAELAGAVG